MSLLKFSLKKTFIQLLPYSDINLSDTHFFFFWVVLGFEFRTLCLLGKHSTTSGFCYSS
jgi:hypothetical protein